MCQTLAEVLNKKNRDAILKQIDLGSSSSNDNMEIFSEIVSLAVLLRLTMKL